MIEEKTTRNNAAEIRRKAEAKVASLSLSEHALTMVQDAKRFFHELQVHQTELEKHHENLLQLFSEQKTLQARYFNLYDLAPVGYVTLDREGKILDANLVAANLLRVGRSSLLKQPFSRYLLEEHRDIFNLQRTRCYESTSPQDVELSMLRADGSCFSVQLRANPADNGEYWITLIDITDRKRAEESLRKSEAQLRAMLDATPFPIALVDLQDDKIAFWSLSALQVFGHTAPTTEEWYQIAYPDPVYRQEVIERWKPMLEKARLSGHSVNTGEYQVTCRDGSERTCELYACFLEERLIVTFTDITDQKHAEQEKHELELQFQEARKQESLGVLAGGLAHNFNNLLQIIEGCCYSAKLEPEKMANHISNIELAAENAAGLCRQMLSYAGKSLLSFAQVKMTELVDDMVKMLSETIPRNVVIKLDLSDDIPSISADANQIRQIVINLIINASEAIGEAQGTIDVSLTTSHVVAEQPKMDHLGKSIPPGQYVCLEVTDTGCGMDEETKQRIFEPFYTTKFTGRGIGMSAVLGIIASHEGALKLTSQQGSGTTFKVYLPIQNIDSTGDESHKHVSLMPWQGSGSVLLVEDAPQIMMVAKTMITELGFTVFEAANGEEALELYRKNAEYIDLVVADIGMPVMDGYQLIRELKKINPKLPIIVSSGFGDADVTSQLAVEDVAGFLNKPYHFAELREVLQGVVERVPAQLPRNV